MKALPLSNKIHLLKSDDMIYLFGSEGPIRPKKIKSIRKHNKFFIVAFHDICDPVTASHYRDSFVHIRRESLVLEKGEFLYEQIIGLTVVDIGGCIVGKVMEIIETRGNDVYVVKEGNKEYLIPAVKDVIKEIDLGKKRIVIKMMEGLMD